MLHDRLPSVVMVGTRGGRTRGGLCDHRGGLLADAPRDRALIPDLVRHRPITHDARLPGWPDPLRLSVQPGHAVRAAAEVMPGGDLARAALPGPPWLIAR